MAIDPGKFDRLITIQSATAARSATGDEVLTWATYKQAWAQKMDVGGRERFVPVGRQGEVNAVFRMHYTSGVLPAMRVSYDGQLYDILYANEIGRRQYLELRCKGVVS